MPFSLFNCEQVDFIGAEQFKEVTHHQKISASVVCVYIRFLYDQVLLPNNLAERFCFLSPVKLNIYETKQSQFISDALSANENPNRIFSTPYNCGGHWVLIVINASDASITYYDSMRGDPRTYTAMKNLFDSGLMTYRAQREHVLPKKKSNTINWSSVKDAYDLSCNFFSQDQVDEIREEWSSYVLQNFIMNK
ncbi:uncharacterized protein LOC130728247 isoform X2 [Lotus japonicus]|uniref:uncharacterized protein LOC130728247 isoform X2 n=1 Tax=Lotus japonicus TaxID=34305 RepID=UPI00258CACA5|nr:uncharacterized protein LOC130728247 isoform X2 [Lotus japonicus]